MEADETTKEQIALTNGQTMILTRYYRVGPHPQFRGCILKEPIGAEFELVGPSKYRDDHYELKGAEWEEAMEKKGHNVNSHLREEGPCLQCGIEEEL